MKIITFPEREWADIKDRFQKGLPVYSIRVSDERGRYDEGEKLMTGWGDMVIVSDRRELSGGLEGLKKAYEYFNELNEEMIDELSGYDEMDILTLEKI